MLHPIHTFIRWSLYTLLFGFTALLAGCNGDSTESKAPQASPLVKTYQVVDEGGAKERRYPGKVVASQQVDLAFEVPGNITELKVKNGDKVKKGDVLAILDTRDFENSLKEAKAALTLATSQFDRAQKLIQSRNISAADFDKAKSAFSQAESKVGLAQKALDDTQLVAPFTGMVANTYIERYQNIQAKQRILSLQNVDKVDILVSIPEQDMIKVDRDPKKHLQHIKKVEFDALPGRFFKVTLKEYTTQANAQTNTFEITLTMSAPGDVNILPGMSLNLFVNLSEMGHPSIIRVPVQAVVTNNDGKQSVWMVDSKTLTVKRHSVKTGELSGKMITILSGLEVGDTVITAGIPHMKEGLKVRLWKKARAK